MIRLAVRHGARNVRVYGSIARGDARSDSDVDILVDLEPGRTLLDLGGLQMDLQDLLGRPVDLKTASSLRADVRQRVADQARAVTERVAQYLEDILRVLTRSCAASQTTSSVL